LLTSEEIKQILRRRIAEEEKEVNPDLYDPRHAQKALAELETLQSFLADITDEEARCEVIENVKN
jgi:hypothetical protein